MKVYDYERKVITDAAVGGIDLRRGHWIHCKWCNSTLKTTSFSLVSWRTHEKGQLHNTHKQEFLSSASQPHLVSCTQSSAQESPSSLPDTPRALVQVQSSQNYESLVVVRRDLHLNKQQQARHERDVTKVINAMTSLVSDQQNDLDALQFQMRNMKREMESLKRQVTFLRRKENQQKNSRAPQHEDAATSYSVKRIRPREKTQGDCNNGRRFVPQKTANIKTTKMECFTEMDIFEKRFRLT
ncbi:hypothetical protein P3T76_004361 [Phytophthora citrophthora]|uniref:Uncharacterized protein n=1 Tax=Phytophthora citrophthora TaxID=4793 RepID=A0AAD9GTQ2_9STRA|nr:hypothetical protein P3T76_004361 [Phytophthora citrophthora]